MMCSCATGDHARPQAYEVSAHDAFQVKGSSNNMRRHYCVVLNPIPQLPTYPVHNASRIHLDVLRITQVSLIQFSVCCDCRYLVSPGAVAHAHPHPKPSPRNYSTVAVSMSVAPRSDTQPRIPGPGAGADLSSVFWVSLAACFRAGPNLRSLVSTLASILT
jgi:hypothetical protein